METAVITAPAPAAQAAPSAAKLRRSVAALAEALRGVDQLPDDTLVDHRIANALCGSGCETSHFARGLAEAGLIEAVRINERNIRYRLGSIRRLVRGEVRR